jgi:type I restriction enzyme M protein
MSEELIQKGLTESGIKIGNYEFYPIGNTTLQQLKKYKIIPGRAYKKYESRRPDALLVDRRNKSKIKVILVVEHKDVGKFTSKADKTLTAQQCNDLCQELKAEIGIATDNSAFVWFNPNQPDPANEYTDRTTGKKRSYTAIKDEDGTPFIKEFIIDQREHEPEITKLNVKTRASLDYVELVRKSVSAKNSQLIKEATTDPSGLAKQIWQDIWSVSGATPEKCLYTFVELFIFKYLSDLNILDEDDKGNKINFRNIYSLSPEVAFKNYSFNARAYLKKMFPADSEDHTTIINGTVLNPDVPEHSLVFYKILKKFDDFGELKNIDPSFKSRVFEDFMKESISKKNWGQFFTPRNIIDSMVEISDIDKLPEGAEICDPACGVGGFILEPMKVKDNGVKFYYEVEGSRIKSRYNFHGFDKGFEKEEQLTIILAKANMLIFVSELLKTHSTLSAEFSKLFNGTFKLLSKTILGTLSKIEKDKYDLIFTNPPYVTSGSSNYKEAIRNDGKLREFYKVNAIGVEGLFLEWIIRSLKPSGKAFVIIPDGILNRLKDARLRAFIKDECIIDGVVSLPSNAFYTTPKKTYILAITKKLGRTEAERKEQVQKEPVFTYLVSNIGETLDVNRFPIPENDLREMVSLFNQFKGAKQYFQSSDKKRCKIQPIAAFDPEETWTVDRWWSKEERVELGVEDKSVVLTYDEFKERVKDSSKKMEELLTVGVRFPANMKTLTVNEIFDLKQKTNSSKFTKDFVNRNKGEIPVYSASKSPDEVGYGYVQDNLKGIKYFENILTWNIDGSVGKAFYRRGRFTLSEKVIPLVLKEEWEGLLDYDYLKHILERKAIESGFTFANKAGKSRIKEIPIEIPVDEAGNFDLKKQQEIAEDYDRIDRIKKQLSESLEEVFGVEIDFQAPNV